MPTKHRKIEKSLKYRWGIVGSILAIGFFLWYANTMGNERNSNRTPLNENLVKIACVRCNGDEEAKKTCSLCNGYGVMWVDETRKDLSPDVQAMVDQASLEKEKK
jgi:hypothetical protein